jgi:hypothetical protein
MEQVANCCEQGDELAGLQEMRGIFLIVQEHFGSDKRKCCAMHFSGGRTCVW